MTDDLQVMVLAAGLGTRLWPLTADRAKPAVPFLGRPLIDHVVRLLAQHGLTRVVVNTHHQPESVRRALGGGALHGVSIAFSHEEEILGTAGCLAHAAALGLLDREKTTLVVNGKLFTDLDLGAAIEAHRRSGAAVTMVLRTNVEREAFREVLVEEDRVAGFGQGRMPASARPLLFTGVHLLSPEVLSRIPAGFGDTVAGVYPPFIEARRVLAHTDDRGRWWELSTLERYVDLHGRAAGEGLAPDVVAAPSARIAPGSRVRRAVLWEDAQVPEGADLDQVVVGAGVELPPGVHLRRTVVVRRELAGEIERGEARGELVYVALLDSAPG